jgi:D-mannonate dehydratase
VKPYSGPECQEKHYISQVHSALAEIESKLLLSFPGPISNVSQAENPIMKFWKIFHKNQYQQNVWGNSRILKIKKKIIKTGIIQWIKQYNVAMFSDLKAANTCTCSWTDIFRLENLSVWQIPVFCYGLLMRNRGYIQLETLEKTVLVMSKEN